MSKTPDLTDRLIRQKSAPALFSKGQSDYEAGNVTSVTRRGNLLNAEVMDNADQPYRVRVGFEQGCLTSVTCSCADDKSEWCEHIVATLLVVMRQPETIQERPTLEQLLAQLNRAQIQGLVQELVKQRPEIIDEIDYYITLNNEIISPIQSPNNQRPSPINPAPFRQQARDILYEGMRYFESLDGEDDPVTEELLDLIDNIQGLIEIGESYNALIVLEAIASACAADWDRVEQYGIESDEIVTAVDEAIAEAILSESLSSREVEQWRSRLKILQEEWSTEFPLSLESLSEGWDDPHLVQALQGTLSEPRIAENSSLNAFPDLVLIRLKILDRQERYQEYLNLAKAQGKIKQYLTMLGSLGRTTEAMEAARNQMKTMEEALSLGQTLRSNGKVNQALEVGGMGLKLRGDSQYKLASWTADLAQELGNTEVELEARKSAFYDNPTSRDYFKIKELAGENWFKYQPNLLNSLREHKIWNKTEVKVDIFLSEGLIDEAIAAVEGFGSYEIELVHRVMDAAIKHRPDWVIETAQPLAESILDRKKSEFYNQAIDWLKKVRAAYIQKEQWTRWKTYRQELLQIHARKHKFRGMLEDRGLD
ncbi:SWIM zinc finger family protein [Laspinema olomoucense]|uniref:SWIM zinc finger domain-containing protein n=1 Tax=Laspinema olomoucense D3b TaxID=2953688 RepID=A0ABT2N0W0_9CYAN|nr:SWIM zinc finger domain-containing protein [Laspinema sp. D3b]MCT7976301.1 SWIM zinc finger domain-containing protein [Laspinema sp. D3b]